MVSFGFTTLLGWLAFISLIPLIILYLIKPKPKEISVPSLMFLHKQPGRQKMGSFFKHFVKDWLFLLQLLIIGLLSLFFVGPYVVLDDSSFADIVVIVVDTSMSMHVGDRFDIAQDYALDNIGKKNTVISIGSKPQILVEGGDAKETKRIIKKLKATESGSSIGDALTLAKEYVKSEKDKVVLVSDMLDSFDKDVQKSINNIESLGVFVDILDVKIGEGALGNVGIVDVTVLEKETEIKIKNYGVSIDSVGISIEGLDNDFEKKDSIDLKRGEMNSYTFQTQPGRTLVKLDIEDSLPEDNNAYVANNFANNAKILLVTHEESVYLKAALTASNNIELDVKDSVPNGDYDLIIISNLDPNKIYGLNNLQEKVQTGTPLIIHGQEESRSINYGDLLGFKLKDVMGRSDLIIHERNIFTKDINFGRVDDYFETTKIKGLPIITSANTNDTIMSISPYGDGQIVFFGIIEESSSFKTSPDYPLFWIKLIEYLSGKGSVGSINVQTGTIASYTNEVKIKNPERSYSSSYVLFDDAGFYEVNGILWAANSESEKESDIEGLNYKEDGKITSSFNLNKKEGIKHPLEFYVILAVLILLFMEFLITKEKRRDYYV